MGHHINDKGEFQSDKYPDLAPDKMVISFKDPIGRQALQLYAQLCHDVDNELSGDIFKRLITIDKDKPRYGQITTDD